MAHLDVDTEVVVAVDMEAVEVVSELGTTVRATVEAVAAAVEEVAPLLHVEVVAMAAAEVITTEVEVVHQVETTAAATEVAAAVVEVPTGGTTRGLVKRRVRRGRRRWGK